MLVKQAANVLDLLEFFADRPQPANLVEISEAMRWPRSSTFNLVSTLTAKGFLFEQKPRAGYYPTPRWFMLAKKIVDNQPLPIVLQQVVDELARDTGETTLLAAQAGASALVLMVAEPDSPIRYVTSVGHRVPLTATSLGRAILSQLSAAERQKVYRESTFERFTETTLLNPEEVEREIAKSHERGYHFNSGGTVPDLFGVALPVAIEGRRLAIGIAGPTARMRERASDIVRQIRRRLNEKGLAPAT